jgi:transposase
MMTNNKYPKDSAEKTVRDIRRQTRRHYSAEDTIRIVLEGLRGEDSIAELDCTKSGINSNVYYRWSKEFLEVGKKSLPLIHLRKTDYFLRKTRISFVIFSG